MRLGIPVWVVGGLLVVLSPSFAEIAIHNEPLKSVFKLQGAYDEFYDTGKRVDAYSFICNMGKAIPDVKKENWYLNKPVNGLRFELRARAAFNTDTAVSGYKAMGFVVVTKNSEVLKVFKPLGEFVSGDWNGDTFISWDYGSSDISVCSEYHCYGGYAYFDILSGNGFYYKSKGGEPDYFLSGCKRIKKTNLPVYDWRFVSSDKNK